RGDCFCVVVQVLHDVIVGTPIVRNLGIDIAGDAVEEGSRAAVGGARREDPFKGRKLPAVWAEHRLKPGKLLHRCPWLAVLANDWIQRAIGRTVKVRVWRVKIDGAEEMEVAGIGRSRPGASEDPGIAGLQPQRCPTSR